MTEKKHTCMETKKEIRKQICRKREALSAEAVKNKSTAIQEKVLQLPEYKEADHILLYADFRHEVMTKDLFVAAIRDKKKVYFPKCESDSNHMDFYQVISVMQLEDGMWGVKEPKADEAHKYHYFQEENTLAIVPGVAFDTQGYRIGYGKGYYDTYLADKRAITLVALAYAEQLLEEVPHEAHDLKMDKIVTEKIIYSFLRI